MPCSQTLAGLVSEQQVSCAQTLAGLVSELLDPGLLAGLLLGLPVGVLMGDPPLDCMSDGGRRLAHDCFVDAAP